MGAGGQLQRKIPSRPNSTKLGTVRLTPCEMQVLFSSRMEPSFASGRRLAGPSLNSQFEPVKIVGRKGGSEDVTHLSVIASSFQFLGGSANRKIVDEYVSLCDSPLRDTADLPKFQVSQMLNAK